MIKCCKDCVAPKRHVGCHSSCLEYLDAKKEHDRILAIRDEKRKRENDFISYEIESKQKTIRRMGRNRRYR